MVTMLLDNMGYQHLLSADKCRIVISAGRGISGDAALTVKPHLDLISEISPRRRTSASETVKKQ